LLRSLGIGWCTNEFVCVPPIEDAGTRQAASFEYIVRTTEQHGRVRFDLYIPASAMPVSRSLAEKQR